MADVNANIGVHIDTSAALAELKNLQRQLASFHSSVSKSSAAAAMAQKSLQTNLLNSINATGKFRAQMGLVRTSTESFTHALETNKLSMREYFRFAGGSTRTFGKLFKQEFNTIGKVAEERVKKMQTQYIKMGRDASGAMKAISITPNTLNMKDYSTKLAVAAQKQALLNQLLKQGSTNLLNFGKNTQWAGRQLMVGFTIPLAYFGTAAAKTFMDLEKQAIRFKRVYGDMFTTTDETNKALSDVQQLAEEFTKYGVAVADTMEMAANAAAMGKTGAELTAQVAQATRLAVLGGVEQEQALETTISVTNAFGIAAEDLANKINFLNAVENQTVVSIEDLTIAIPKAGPVVKQLGGNVEDLAFFLTAMKEGGINASEGANALKSGLASLINPTKKASDMLAGFGVNINAIVEGNQGNIKQTVIDFAQALDTLDPLNRARAIEQLFGKFQFSRLSTLFQNVTKDGTQAARVLQLAGASIEELAILSERELGVLEDAVGTNFKESVEKLKLAIAPIGKTFLEAVTPIVEVVGRLLDKFNNLGEGTKKFIVVASTLVGVIGPVLLMTFGLLANGVANIIKLFITMRSGFLRAGTNTSLLAQQTQYLNSEQLEAATVAASLNQAHTRLTQSFSAETSAVRLLRQAYIDATVAAANFARANPGMMMPGRGGATPKKFARGSNYVPGTGNKDTVASLLTPGEAVIPKDVAQDPRFQPIIDAMVSGKLKGFNRGTRKVAAGDDYTHLGGQKSLSIDELLKDPRISPLEKQKLEAYKQVLISRGKPTTIGSYGSLAYSFDSRMNKALAKGGVPIDSFEKAWTSRGPEKWMPSNIPPSEARLIDEAILKQIKSSGATVVTDGMVEGAFKNLPPEIKATPAYSKMDSLHSQLGSYGIGPGLGSNPKTSEAILAEAKRKGYIKDYKIVTRTNKKGAIVTKSLTVTNLDGSQANLGRGSRTNREYIADTQGTRRKSGMVTGQTGTAKSSGVMTSSGAPSEKRTVSMGRDEAILNKKTTTALKSGRSAFIPGLGRLRIAGAQDGLPTGQTQGGVKQIPFSSASAMRVQESQMNKLIDSLDNNTKVTDDGTQTTTKLTKEQKREVRAQRAGAVGRVAGPVAGIAGIGSMAGFMTGNNSVGMAMMGVSALASIAPMLTNPLGLFVAGLVSITALIYKFNKDMEKARQKGIDLANAMSMTNTKLIELSKITGKVTATEAANRRRENILSGVSEGKRQFGQNVLESEIGKQMSQNMSTQLVSGRSEQEVARNFANQLAVSVTQGAITTEQARSIAVALGDELGDYEIPALISGQLVRILGPDGQNLESDPINVLLNVQKSSMADVQAAFDDAITGANSSVIKSNLQPYEQILNMFGDVVRAETAEQNQLLRSQAIQTGINAVSQGQGQLDIANQYYNTKLKTAKTEGEIKKIEDDRKIALDEINDKNAANLKTIISLKNQIPTSAFDTTIKTAVDNLYKDADKVTKDLVNNALSGLKQIEDVDLRTTLQIGMASGAVKEGAARKILEYATSNKDFSTNLKLLIDSQGTNEAMSIISLLSRTKASAETVNLFIKYAIDNEEDFSTVFSSITALSKMEETYGFEFDLNTNGKEKFEAAVAAVKQIQDLPEDLTFDIVKGLAEKNPGEWAEFYAQWDNLTLQGKNQTVNRTVKIAFDAASKDKPLLDRIAAGPKDENTLGELLGLGGGIPGLTTQGIERDPPDPKTRDTTFDDILVNLKQTRDATINAQGGAKELIRILSGAKDLKAFNGIDQQLSKIGANSDFIDFVGGLGKAIQNDLINVSKKGVVSLTELGKATKKAYDEKQLGLFSAANAQAINESMKQRDAFVKLKAAGLDTATAQELLADKTFMVSIAAQKNSKEVKNMINQYKNLKTVIKETTAFVDPLQGFKDEMEDDLKYYDFLEKQARANAKTEIERINDLIDANERLIEAQDRVIEESINRPISKFSQDLALIDRSVEEINNKYDAQERALEQISEINDDIAAKELSRITIADALTMGDISAAAKAIQEQRAEEARRAKENSSKLLQIAREKEISKLTNADGLTKIQIEEKIYALEQQRLPLVANIVKLQDENYKLQTVTLRAQEDSLKTTLSGIDAARFAYEQQIIAIEAAQYKANGFNNILLVGEATLARMKALWDSINSKSAIQVPTAGRPITDRNTGRSVGKTVTEIVPGRKLLPLATGGQVPKYMVSGGYSKGTDTIPAMLTPGEFVVRKNSVDSFGVNNLNKINDGSYGGSSVYNYSLSVNVKSDSSPDDIARTVMTQIKQIDSQRIKTQRGA
jgi:TP901 family phage tail tape measure protein